MATAPDDELSDLFSRPEEGPKSEFLAELDQRIDEELSNEAPNAEGGAEEGPASANQEPPAGAKDSAGGKADQGTKPGQAQRQEDALGPGDLKLRDGTIIKGGAERRFYEQAQILRRQNREQAEQIQQLREQAERARTELNAIREATTSIQGTDPETASRAIGLWQSLRADPAGTLKTLLTEAAANGIRVLDAPGGPVDVASIVERKVAEAIAPILKQQEPMLRQQEAEQAAMKEYQELLARFPDVRLQEDVFAAFLERNPHLTMSEAYYQLRLAVAERGLDWSRPLAEQMQDNASETKAPMTQGRVAPAASMVPANRKAVAPSEQSYSQIIRDVLAQTGVRS